jgi:signal transduction histidine kinase
LSISGEPSLEGVWDRFRLEQALVNLLTNAMKYGAGKPIEVHLSSEGGKALVSIRDHGIGIAKENQERVFSRFERAVGEGTFTGLGLGLYITRQIVLAHDGVIKVQSELGHGSTFTMELPFEVRVREIADAQGSVA